MGFWRQLQVVIWKNLIIRKRHWFLTIFEAFLPVCLFLLIAYGRSQIDGLSKVEIHEPTYNVMDKIQYSINVGNTYILYTPNSDYYTNIISRMHTKFEMPSDHVQRFGSEKELLEYYYKNPNSSTIAIIFDGADPKKFNYKIRYHESLKTGQKYDKVYTFIPGGGGLYEFNDFVPVQLALDMSFLEYNLKEDIEDKYNFFKQEFPYPPYKMDVALISLFLEFLPVITLFSFIFICPAVLKRVVEEKYSGTKELLKMVGMKSWMLWLGWFIYGIIPMIFAVVCIVFLMKVPVFGSDYPLIEHSDGGILFCFLMLYCMAAIAFCFAISSFFSRPTIALVTGILVWILSFFIPKYALGLDQSNQLSWSTNVFLNIIPNMALHYGYVVISVYEEREVGVNWNNYYKSGTGSSEDVSMLNVFLMLLLDIFIYTILSFYMDGVNPGKYGVRKRILFPIFDLIKKFKKSSTDIVRVDYETVRLEKVEAGLGLSKGIEINHLCKRYGHNVAVNNLNLDIYKNQITVLLGHNGAGKSTTMSIITGMLQATSGSVRVNGMDIRTDMDQIRQNLGLCPQHNLLFTDLTVIEHLLFFAKLKGKSSDDARIEAKELLKILNMCDKENSMTHTLSGGMQRKLCLGMAVIGGSKVLILDEPSSGMDPESRRQLWDLLLSWRGEKTILITTHFMEEADVLGDRIAIMSGGSLNCYGTPMFLKKRYDTGYHLSLILEEGADKEFIQSEIKKEIAKANIKSVDGNNMVLVLPFESNSKMPDILSFLESKRSEFKIEHISITVTTLEDVFLKTHVEGTDNCNNKSSVDTQVVSKDKALLQMKLKTLFIKKLQFFRKKLYTFYCVPVCVAFIFFILTVYLSAASDYCSENGPELRLQLSTYKQTSVYYNGTKQNNATEIMMNLYSKITDSEKSLPFQVNNVEQAILDKSMENIAYYKEHIIVGANFIADEPSQLVAMYNAIALHSLPISLNLVTNTLVKTLLGPDYSISASNWPLPFINEYVSSQELSETKVAVLWLIMLPVGCLFIHGSFIIFPHTEISTKFVKIQYMCGVKPVYYWLVNFVSDFSFYVLVMFVLTGILTLSPMLGHMYDFGLLFGIFVLYGLAGIPFTYLFSRKGTVSGAFALFVIMGMFLGIILTIIIEILLQSQDQYYINIGTNLKYVCFLFIPHVGLTDALVTFARRAIAIHNYQVSPKKLGVRCSAESHPCCIADSIECNNYKHYDNLFIEHILMLGGCCIYLLINMFLDSYWLKNIKSKSIYLYYKLKQRIFNDEQSETLLNNKDNDDNQSNNIDGILQVSKLSKFYDGKPIVKNISLTLERGHCLGILGVNGAGKTTTFRMLTRDEILDSGNIDLHLNDEKIDIKNDRYLETLGYCPQLDSLNYVLTGRQILTSVAALRGIDDKNVVNAFLEAFDLAEYADKPCGYYSGGNKRKLSLAVSLIGIREFVLLDEPTNGVDPSTRRKCWNLIKNMQKSKGFILTSHSMNECEALCNELKIMKNGVFVENGTLTKLKNDYGGFTLKLKLFNKPKCDEVDCAEFDNSQFNSIEDIKSHFTKNNRGELKDQHSGLLHFYIKDENKRWSDIFREVEAIKTRNLHLIEDYAISEASLEDVFLKIARSEEDTVKKPMIKKENKKHKRHTNTL